MKGEVKGKILVVDDTPANIGVLVGFLQEANMDIRIAEDGEDALNLVAYSKPDLILLDIMMPGIDGFETCRRLKAQPETAEIPILFISALGEPTDKVKGLEVGAVDFITKPFHNEEVLARVRTHLKLKSLQKALVEKEVRLESIHAAEEAKTAFLSLMNNDLRRPFIQVRSYAELLESHVNREGRLYLESLKEESDQAESIISRILTLVKSDEITKNDQGIQLESLGKFVVNSFRKQRSTDQEIEYYCDPNTPETITGNSAILRRILFSILENAIHYSEKKKVFMSMKPKVHG